jgi:hypothetical protein
MTGKEKMAGLDRAALAKAQMERGTYVWPDGRQRFQGDGTFRVVKTELMAVAGFSPKYVRGFDYFDDRVVANPEHEKHKLAKYFADRVAYYRLKLDGGFKKALMKMNDRGQTLDSIVACLEGSLLDDLLDEEVRVSFKDKASLYAQLKPLSAKLDADSHAKDKDEGPSFHADVMNVILTQIQDPNAQAKLQGSLNSEAGKGAQVAEDVIDVTLDDAD